MDHLLQDAAVSELDLCRAWLALPRSHPLTTTTGESVDVVHLGSWTHGFGPDFRDALISIGNGPIQSGAVELHLRTRGWTDHGHHLDPAYNSVVLHVVASHDAVETRRADGKLVPTVVLGVNLHGGARVGPDWSLVGGAVCAQDLSRNDPALIVRILERLGDRRNSARASQLASELVAESPDAVLYRRLADAFGYTANRQQMTALTARIPLTILQSERESALRRDHAIAMLQLGAGGFLPLSESEIELSGLDPETAHMLGKQWPEVRMRWSLDPLPPTVWQLARIRPANSPIRRIVQFAALLDGLDMQPSASVLDAVRSGMPLVDLLIRLVTERGAPPLGKDRAIAIATSVLTPFAFAMADVLGDRSLAEAAAETWDRLPAESGNERTRRATAQIHGEGSFRGLRARAQHGLMELDTSFCGPRRCYECPIAHSVVMQTPVLTLRERAAERGDARVG